MLNLKWLLKVHLWWMNVLYSVVHCVFLQLQEQLTEVEHERDLLKESNAKLLNRFGSVTCQNSCSASPLISGLMKYVDLLALLNVFAFQCLRRVPGTEVADPGAAAEGADFPAGESIEG